MTSSEPHLVTVQFKDRRIDAVDGAVLGDGKKWLLLAAVKSGARRNGYLLIRQSYVRRLVPAGRFTSLAATVVGSWPPAPLTNADGNEVELDLDHKLLPIRTLGQNFKILGYHYERRKGEGLVDGVPGTVGSESVRFRIVGDDGVIRSSSTKLDRDSLIAVEISSPRLEKLAERMIEAPRVEESAVEATVVEEPSEEPKFMVRLGMPQDIAGIQALHQRDGFAPPAARFLERVMDDPDSLLVVAEDREGAVVGGAKANFIPASVTEPEGYYLSGIRVADGHRREGIGRELGAARLDWLRRRAQCAYATAPAPNQPGRRYLGALGFSEIPTPNPRTQPTDSVLMEIVFDESRAH